MELNGSYNQTANETYTGDPMKPLDDLQNSRNILGFGNDSLTARLGLQLDMMISNPAAARPSTPGHTL